MYANAPETACMLTQSAQPSAGPAAHVGYRIGEAGYRRITVALFAAGVATFALIYSTQALLPEFPRAFSLPPPRAPCRCRSPRSASEWRCSSPGRCPRSWGGPA